MANNIPLALSPLTRIVNLLRRWGVYRQELNLQLIVELTYCDVEPSDQ